MRNNIVQGSDSSEAEVFDLIKRIEKGLEKFQTLSLHKFSLHIIVMSPHTDDFYRALVFYTIFCERLFIHLIHKAVLNINPTG